MEFKEFVLEHEGDDLSRLVLSRERYPGVAVALAASTIVCRRKLRDKVPEWYAHPELFFPVTLSAEQCSSSATARYKAVLAAGSNVVRAEGCTREDSAPLRFAPAPPTTSCVVSDHLSMAGPSPSTGRGWPASLSAPLRPDDGHLRIADLTGGLGVDSWAFAQVAGEVLYNEADGMLAEAARRNFEALGVENVTVRNCRVGDVPIREILDGFEPDVIFLDPARRGEGGRKVFLLEDCSPDVTALMPELLATAPRVLLKLAPMADISMLLDRIPCVRELHIVSVKGECKELLLLSERGFDGEAEIVAVEIATAETAGASFRFRRSEEREAKDSFASLGMTGRMSGLSGKEPAAGDVLFEPGKALAKAGCFNLLATLFPLIPLGRDSHLYVLSAESGSADVCDILKHLGKLFKILDVLPLDKRAIAAVGAAYPNADVTARGVPMRSEELAARLARAAKGAKTAKATGEKDSFASLGMTEGAPGMTEGVPVKADGALGMTGVHIFAVHCDAAGRNLLLVSQK